MPVATVDDTLDADERVLPVRLSGTLDAGAGAASAISAPTIGV